MDASIPQNGKLAWATLASLFLFSFAAFAADPKPRATPAAAPRRNPAEVRDAGERVLKVKGQSRNLNMMLILRGENDHVEFGDTRKDYREEVIQTQY